MADSNRVGLSVAEEVTFGVAPGGNYDEIPLTSHSLRGNIDRQTSNVIRSDAQEIEPQQLGIGASGDVGTEIMYGAVDKLIAGAFRHSRTWASGSTIKSASVDISFNATTGVITLATGTWAVTPTASRWIRIGGATNAGNNSVFKVASATTTTITVENKEGMVTEAAGQSITIKQGEQVTNGTELPSWSLEATHPDLSVPLFPRWVGMVINQFNLTMAVRAFGTMSFGFMGKKEVSPCPTAADGTLVPYTQKPSMQCVDNVLKAQYKSLGVELREFNLQIQNGVAAHDVLGELGAKRMRAGSFTVGGGVKAYFQDATLLNDFLANTTGTLALVLKDSDTAPGNIYVIDIPAMKFGTAPRDVTGKNADVMIDLSVLGFRDSVENVTLRMVRFPLA